MITYYTTDITQIDLLQYKLDSLGIKYNLEKSNNNTNYLMIDGIPLDFIRALKWVSMYERSNT